MSDPPNGWFAALRSRADLRYADWLTMGIRFDDDMLKVMSDYLIAANRLKFAQTRPASLDDPTVLRRLAAEESDAERACAEALEARGWISPYRATRSA